MGLADKMRKIAEGAEKQQEQNNEKEIRSVLKEIEKEIENVSKKGGSTLQFNDGSKRYDFFHDTEIGKEVLRRLEKEGFETDDTEFYVMIRWD
jgi:hypothetical protein